jgi:DNA polymerase V
MKLFPLFEETDYPTDALLAHVSAGEPLEIASEFEQVDLNYLMTKGNPYCMLIRVRGDSMSEEIRDGDWVMIDRQRQPQLSDIVLARLNGGFTIKRHRLTHDDNGRRGLYLVPANTLHTPKKVDEHDDFEILGVVTHIIHPTI